MEKGNSSLFDIQPIIEKARRRGSRGEGERKCNTEEGGKEKQERNHIEERKRETKMGSSLA